MKRLNALLPVEVKSGLRGRMKSLRLLMAEKKIPFGIRLSLENFSSLPDVGILPLYAVHRLCAETPLLSGAEERSF